MSYCKRISDQDYRLQLAQLTKALGDSNAAIAVLESNNDFPLTKAPNGKDSILYNDLYKKLKEVNPILSDYEAQTQALKLKAVTHSSQFKNWFGDWVNGQGSKIVDTNGEPKIVFGLDTNERFDLSKEVDNTTSEVNRTGTYTFSEIQLNPSQSGYFIRSFNPNTEETFDPNADSVVKNNEQSGIIQVKNSNQIKTAIHTTKYSEHIRDEFPGDYDVSLQELFNSRKKGGYSYSVQIPLRDFINYLGQNTKYKTLFQLIGAHKDPNGPSLLDGLVIVLDSNSNALFGADASRMHEEYRNKRAYYIDSDRGGELHINVDGKYQDGDADSVIWHELMHRMTVRRLQDPVIRSKFQTILNDYLQVRPDMRYNGEQGLEEFVANIWFDPETIENLKRIPSPRAKKSLWEEIKEFFREIIHGIIPDDSLFAEASYELDALFDSVETNATNKKFGDHIGALPEETSQIIKLIQYQRSWQGVSQEDINAEITDFLKGGAKSSVKKLIDKVQIRQAELHVLGYDFNDTQPFSWNNYLGGIDLDIPITKENLNPDRFTKLTYYKVDPAEIVVPKLYRSAFKLGGRHLSEIDAEYFSKINPYYKSKFTDPVDFIVRTHTGNVSIIVKDSLNLQGYKIVTPEIKDGWRVTPKGDRMYKLPDDINDYQIYKDVYGNELIVFKDNNRAQKNVKRLMSSTENLVSIQPILQNVTNPDEWLEMSLDVKSPINTFDNELYSILNHSQNIKQDLLNLYENGEQRYQKDLSNTLYNSFVKTLYMMSVRIPTQAFQSIMATKIAELTDDTENAIFVTRWQFWLQGSDLDIKR